MSDNTTAALLRTNDLSSTLPAARDVEAAVGAVATALNSIDKLPPELAAALPNIHHCLKHFVSINEIIKATEKPLPDEMKPDAQESRRSERVHLMIPVEHAFGLAVMLAKFAAVGTQAITKNVRDQEEIQLALDVLGKQLLCNGVDSSKVETRG